MSSSRKYTPEQIQAEIDRPKHKGGRPKKYNTPEEKQEAIRASRMRTYYRKKKLDNGMEIDGALALRKAKHSTDEERRHARVISSMRINQEHPDKKRLTSAVHYYTHRIPWR